MQDWKSYLDQYSPSELLVDDIAALRVCQLALNASQYNCYGVGAVLLDAQGGFLAEGQNSVFVDGFRSELHAEMVAITNFEKRFKGEVQANALTLVSSLEPCPMCMARLIYSGIGNIRYVCEDPLGGMVSRFRSLPPKLQEMSKELSQSWQLADCSAELREAARAIFERTRDDIDHRITKR